MKTEHPAEPGPGSPSTGEPHERRGPLARIGLLGVPYDRGSSFLAGAAGGPAAVREALASPAGNRCTESGQPLDQLGFVDLGDVEIDPDAVGPEALEAIEAGVDATLPRVDRAIFVGGDHSVTWPIARALHRRHPHLSILQLDAHPDLYAELDGDRFSHACPFARILEEGLCRRLVQVGIRSPTPEQLATAQRFGVEQIAMRDLRADTDLTLDGPVHLSLDLDVLDPAFAPGVSHPEPGGLSTRELLSLLARSRLDLVSADVVELNPRRDANGATARVAALLVRELVEMLHDGA